MGCISKLGLFVLNFAIFGVGIAVVVLSSLIISENKAYAELLTDGIFSVPICILIAGIIIVIIGFLGCCGAIKENSCMLKTYAFIVIVLLIAEIVLGILILVYPSETEEFIQENMNKTFSKYGTGDSALDDTIDNMEHELECCGVLNYTDWAVYSYSGGRNVSEGCCREKTVDEPCFQNVLTLSYEEAEKIIYTRGCYGALKEDIKGTTIGLGVVTLILAVVQAFAISCACGLAKESRYA